MGNLQSNGLSTHKTRGNHAESQGLGGIQASASVNTSCKEPSLVMDSILRHIAI